MIPQIDIDSHIDRQLEPTQAAEYELPYHWIPRLFGSPSCPGRALGWYMKYETLIRIYLELASLTGVETVLDFGSGDGRISAQLADAQPQQQIFGLEIDPRAKSWANQLAGDRTNLQFVSDMAETTRDFDLIVANEVFEHIRPAHLGDVTRRLRSVARPGCRLAVCVPSTEVPVPTKHYQHFDLHRLDSYFNDDEWELIECRYVDRRCLTNRLLTGIASNHFYTLNWKPGLRLIGHSYSRFLARAEPATCSVIVAIYEARA